MSRQFRVGWPEGTVVWRLESNHSLVAGLRSVLLKHALNNPCSGFGGLATDAVRASVFQALGLHHVARATDRVSRIGHLFEMRSRSEMQNAT
jgi:hypothetical protein